MKLIRRLKLIHQHFGKSLKCVVSAVGNEMKFHDINYRDSKSITREWGLYFKELYTPSNNPNYDSAFYDFLTKHMNDVNTTVFNTPYLKTQAEVSLNEIITAISKKAKKSKAGGEDKICYEHIIYGGLIIRQLLSKLYTMMFQLSYTPINMKKV